MKLNPERALEIALTAVAYPFYLAGVVTGFFVEAFWAGVEKGRSAITRD